MRAPAGSARVVLVHAGHRVWKGALDGDGAKIDARLERAAPPAPGGPGGVRVECDSAGELPVLIDGKETGLLCPTHRIRLSPGRHTIGVYLPASDTALAKELPIGGTIRSLKFRR